MLSSIYNEIKHFEMFIRDSIIGEFLYIFLYLKKMEGGQA
jgi:hypothetical protein